MSKNKGMLEEEKQNDDDLEELSNSEHDIDAENPQQAVMPEGGLQQQPLVNSNQYIGGLPTRESILNMAGGVDPARAKYYKNEIRAPLDAIDSYHQELDQMVSMEELYEFSFSKPTACLINVIQKLEAAIEAYNSTFFYKHNVAMRAFIPVYASLMMQAVNYLPRLIMLEDADLGFMLELDEGESNDAYTKKQFPFSELIEHASTRLMGQKFTDTTDSFVNIKQGDTIVNQNEVTDANLNLYENIKAEGLTQTELMGGDLYYHFREAKQSSRMAKALSLSGRVIPDLLLEGSAAGLLTTLDTMLRIIDDAAIFETDNSNYQNNGADVQASYFGLRKMISTMKQAPKELLDEVFAQQLDPEGKPLPMGQRNLSSAAHGLASMLQSISGKTIKEAAQFAKTQVYADTPEELGANVRRTGGAVSEVYIDFDNKRILRRDQSQGHLEGTEDYDKFNGFHDEALYKLDQLYKANVVAQARVVSYKDRMNQTHYGSEMALARGKEAASINFSFEDLGQDAPTAYDKSMIAPFYEPDESQEQPQTVNMFKDPRLITDLMRLQVVDFVACSEDRHTQNFMIDLNAKQGQSMVTGIDNDRAFSWSGSGTDKYISTRANAPEDMEDINASYNRSASLPQAFSMITPEIRQMVMDVTPEMIQKELGMYMGKNAMMLTLDRAKKMRAKVESAEVVDLQTEEGMEKYKQHMKNILFDSYASIMQFDTHDKELERTKSAWARTGSLIANMLGNSFIASIKTAKGQGSNDALQILKGIAAMGFTKEQLLQELQKRGALKKREPIPGEYYPSGQPKMREVDASVQDYMNNPTFVAAFG